LGIIALIKLISSKILFFFLGRSESVREIRRKTRPRNQNDEGKKPSVLGSNDQNPAEKLDTWARRALKILDKTGLAKGEKKKKPRALLWIYSFSPFHLDDLRARKI
jgi:hypothetical protein